MKKTVIFIAAITLFASILSSCSHTLCPAYCKAINKSKTEKPA